MLLIRAWITDPILVFLKNLSVNIYLYIFIYINILMKNLGFDINNKYQKRPFRKTIRDSIFFFLYISPLIMIYFIFLWII